MAALMSIAPEEDEKEELEQTKKLPSEISRANFVHPMPPITARVFETDLRRGVTGPPAALTPAARMFATRQFGTEDSNSDDVEDDFVEARMRMVAYAAMQRHKVGVYSTFKAPRS